MSSSLLFCANGPRSVPTCRQRILLSEFCFFPCFWFVSVCFLVFLHRDVYVIKKQTVRTRKKSNSLPSRCKAKVLTTRPFGRGGAPSCILTSPANAGVRELWDGSFKKKQKAYDTRDSQAVSDPSTNRAQRCLTCQIGRDGVLSTWCGRKRTLLFFQPRQFFEFEFE